MIVLVWCMGVEYELISYGRDWSINGQGDVEQTDGWTNPNYSMMAVIYSMYSNPIENIIYISYESVC